MTDPASESPFIPLVCPVRGCSQPLRWEPGRALCPRGHLFDRSRSGYCNLLQVQDRRSTHPGDSKAAVQARRRSLARGLGDPLREALEAELARRSFTPGALALDAGCGEGTYLEALCARAGLRGWGVDISTPAVEAAARAHPARNWVVANADRTLPFAEGAFELITSITARKNPAEFRRLLAPGGLLLVAVAHEEDQKELRGALYGDGADTDRAGATAELFAPFFELEGEREVLSRVLLDPPALRDLLQGSYRGGRFSAQETLAGLDAQEVTLAYRILAFRPLPASGAREGMG